ncbi:MAG: ArsA family ATPase [Acidimicrobiia bacterium]
MSPLAAAVERAALLVCVGAGGVGKTSTSAALGVAAARRGRRAVVVTIDPARRLADALGVAGVGNRPVVVPGPWPGTLTAVMLDTASTFDDVVRLTAPDPEQAERIVANRFYRNIADTLSGTREYMAGEKLLELLEGGGHDIVIVDTPPSERALDFLEAPGRLVRLLDHRVYRALVTPVRGYGRALHLATRGFLRAAGRLVGSELVDDAVAFFAAFEGMDAGFRARADRVRTWLHDPATAYVLVVAPRSDALAGAHALREQLEAAGIRLDAVVVNRVHPHRGDAAAARRSADELAGTDLGALWANLADLAAVAEDEDAALAALAGAAPSVRVPSLEREVTDLDALGLLADRLVPAPP